MTKNPFLEWGVDSPKYWGLLGILAAVAAVGVLSALYMEHEGHWVTGMTNQIVWGLPHVFAVFLIVAASGALNVAAIGSVFNKKTYKPLGRLSGLLAITLLVGGLMVLVLDLGRADRLLVAMTYYNFTSIFAWNIILYTGFMAIVAVYLWTMMDRSVGRFYKGMGIVGATWRIVLTTGTGSIFGFIVARQGYDAAIMAPWFILMSFAYGLAFYLLFLMFTFKMDGRELGDVTLRNLKNLLALFTLFVLYFTIVYHLTNLYGTENHEYEAFILRDGGIYTWLFWGGHVFLGGLLPIGILYHPTLGKSRGGIVAAASLVVLGGLMTMYMIIIGGQAFPMAMFPGKTVIESGFYDGVNGQPFSYVPSMLELLLGLGGVAVTLLLASIGVRMLKFLPASLADEAVDPHHSKAA